MENEEKNQVKEQAKDMGKNVAKKGGKTILKAIAPIIIKIVAIFLLLIVLVSGVKIIFNKIISAVIDAVSGDGKSYYTVDENDGSISISNENIDALIESIKNLGIDLNDIHLMGDLADYEDEDVQEKNQEALRKYIRKFYEAQAVMETLNYKPNLVEELLKTYGRVYVYRTNENDTDITQRTQLEYVPYEQLTGKKLEETAQSTMQSNPGTSNQGSQTTVSSLDNFLFLGDSRTVGIQDQLKSLGNNVQVIAVGGSMPREWVNTVKNGSGTVHGTSVTLPNESEIKGISVALGINRYVEETNITEGMKNLIDGLLKRYPNTPIYINSVFNVGSGYSYNGLNTTIMNDGVKQINDWAKSYSANNSNLIYVDVTNGLYDENNCLKASLSWSDKIHLNTEGDNILVENIKTGLLGGTTQSNNDSQVNSLDNFLFIGDSRTRGAKTELESLGNNITVYGVDSSSPADWVDVTKNGSGIVKSSSITLPDATQVKGISVALGVNNTSDDKNMKKVLENLLARYPDVPIYVNSVFHVGTSYTYNNPITMNTNIDDFNNKMKTYCNGNSRLYYIDITNGLYEESGYLTSDYTSDGLHLKGDAQSILAQNIRTAITNNGGGSTSTGGGTSYQGGVVHPAQNVTANPYKYFSINGNGELVILGTRTTTTTENGKTTQYSTEYIETVVDYRSAISQYTTPVTFLVSLTITTGNPEFVSALTDLIKYGRIEITVMDNVTNDKTTTVTEYTEHTKKRVKESVSREDGSPVYGVKESSNEKTNTKVEIVKTVTPNPQITYVKTWFCEQTIEYKKDTTSNTSTTQGQSPTSQAEPALPETGEGSVSWTTYGPTTITIEQETSTYTESIRKDVVDKTGEKGDQGLNDLRLVDENTTILGLLDDKFRIPNTIRYEFAGQNLMSDAEWLFDLLQQDQSLQNLEMVMRYVMYKYTGRDYGVTELDFSIFQTNTITSGGMGIGVVGNTLEEKVWYTLRNAGYSEYAVAGVMGNIWGESRFDPNIVEKGNGIGFGLCQWSYGRRTNLENYARAKGVAASDVDTQIEFLLGELNPKGGCNGYATYQLMTVTRDGKTYRPNDWLNASNVEDATVAFCYTFERPKFSCGSDRISAAQRYYEMFKGKTMAASDGIFWWPVGSLQTTSVNGVTFASGSPSATNITSGFGYRNTGIDGASTNHKGIDIGSGGKGSGYHNVIASANGKVVLVHSSASGARGCYVKIDHGNGIQTISQHLAAGSIIVTEGQVVQKGQVIAKMGNTGVGSGAHLHFEVLENGTPVNPTKYVSNTTPRP